MTTLCSIGPFLKSQLSALSSQIVDFRFLLAFSFQIRFPPCVPASPWRSGPIIVSERGGTPWLWSRMKSDALVVFGFTGDLAYKKIFPALQALAARGQLNV